MQVPSRSDILEKLNAVIEGSVSREDANNWAAEYIICEDSQIYPEVQDPLVWEGISFIYCIDLLEKPNEYLLAQEDIEQWVSSYEEKMLGNH